MRQIADLHIHSRFSRACSKDLTLRNIEKACLIKGVDIIATGDFTHPEWFREIESELSEISGSTGLYGHKDSEGKVKFILSGEVALIYKKFDRCRRIHLVIHAPDIASARELNYRLGKNHNISSDGRPILGIPAEEMVKLCLEISPDFIIYPAHIWTPWFSVFGSKSGFDRIQDCFGEMTDSIFAYETGLSSDPEMNWRLSALDPFSLLSNSDAHSLPNIGREANVFDLQETSYMELKKVLVEKTTQKGSFLDFTIEFFPEEGMYHFDGHRSCGVCLHPAESRKIKGICPVCKKHLVIGVLSRVEDLADRPAGFRPKDLPGYRKLVEMDKIIAESIGIKSRNSRKVQEIYREIISNLGAEIPVLLDTPTDKIKTYWPEVASGIDLVRRGDLTVSPGYDGEYGKIEIFGKDKSDKQARLNIL